MATTRSFGNMLNSKPVMKKPGKEEKAYSPWIKIGGR
jgi:hypothetical protein